MAHFFNSLSYSNLSLYCKNKGKWYERYVLKQEPGAKGMSMLVGAMVHLLLEKMFKEKISYWELNEKVLSNETMNEIFTKVSEEYSIDSTIDIHLSHVRQAMVFYVNYIYDNFNQFKNIEHIEFKSSASIEGVPFPLLSIADLIVTRDNGDLEIIDHKVVSKFSAESQPKLAYYIQGWFMYQTVQASFPGASINAVIFNEIKKTKNQKDSPQVRAFRIEAKELKDIHATMLRMISYMAKEIKGEPLLLSEGEYVPNFFSFSEQENLYCLEQFKEVNSIK